MENLTILFKALSDPHRVEILRFLEKGSACVCEFPSALDLALSTVSKHLSILREAGFVVDKKIGKWVHYSLNINSSNIIVRQLLSLLPMWELQDNSIKLFPSISQTKNLETNLNVLETEECCTN